MQQQLDTERNISAQMAATHSGYQYLKSLKSAIFERQKSVANDKPALELLEGLSKQVTDLAEGSPTELGIGPLNRELGRLATMIESGDSRPAAALQSGVDQSCQQLGKRLAQWRELQAGAMASTNALLQKGGQQPLPVMSKIPMGPNCSK